MCDLLKLSLVFPFLICNLVISTFVMLCGGGLRASIDSSRGLSNSWGCSFPIETRRQPIRSAPRGLHPHHALSRSNPTLSGSPPAPYPKPPSYAPAVHNPLSLPSVPLSGTPRTGASNRGLRPRDNNASAVPKWCQITMLFNGPAKPGRGQKQTMDGHIESSISASEVA